LALSCKHYKMNLGWHVAANICRNDFETCHLFRTYGDWHVGNISKYCAYNGPGYNLSKLINDTSNPYHIGKCAYENALKNACQFFTIYCENIISHILHKN
jgi:hypothetical protein